MAERDYASLGFKAGVACVALAMLMLFAYALGSAIWFGPDSAIAQLLPIITMLIVVLASFLMSISVLLLIYEIATSKNEGGWKALWIAILFFLGVIGVAIYFAAGRKERIG